MLSKYGYCMHLVKIRNKLKIGCFYRQSREEFSIIILGPFFVVVGYEMIITKRALHALLAIFDLISKWHSWNIVNY